MNIYENNEEVSSPDESAMNSARLFVPASEEWLQQQAECIAFSSNSECVYRILSEIRNESKLQQIIESPRFDRRILTVIIERSFDDMIKRFKQDCFQHNPHMNYLKVPLVLRLAIDALVDDIESICSHDDDDDVDEQIEITANALTKMLCCIERTECECLVYVGAQFVEQFIEKQFLRHKDFDVIIRFVCECLARVQRIMENRSNDMNGVDGLQGLCEGINAVLRQRHIVAEINNNLAKHEALTNALVPTVYEVLKRSLVSATFMKTHALEHLVEQQRHRRHCEDTESELKYAKAIFIGKFVESCYAVDADTSTVLTANVHHLVQFKVRGSLSILPPIRINQTVHIFRIY